MTLSLRKRRANAFRQLDRITAQRRLLLERWLNNATLGRCAYTGMTSEEAEAVNHTIADIREFCAIQPKDPE